jgi:dTDP-4-amino-4,6-dideoxygalactose transaminase
MNIPFVDLQGQYRRYKSEIDTRIQGVLQTSSYIHGEDVGRFERNFAKYIGVEHCVGVANGTDALEIAVQSLQLPEDAEVIVQGNTYIASCLGVVNNGHRLVVADCDPDTHMISYTDLMAKITPATRAIILVHLFGTLSPDIEAIQRVCEERGITLIEDCAQSHGATWKGRKAGTFGTLSCYSFYPGKNLGAYGDGGAICTNDDRLAARIRLLANLGCRVKYHHEVVGRNSRLDTLQAAVLDVKLAHLDADNARRQRVAEQYHRRLAVLDVVGHIRLPVVDAHCGAVYHLFVIRCRKPGDRDALKRHLEARGVACGIHYPISITEVEAFQHLSLPPATACIRNAAEILSLPMHTELTKSEVAYVCDSVIAYFGPQPPLTFESFQTPGKPGILRALNAMSFDTRRIFWVEARGKEDVGKSRGNHANLNFDEFMFVTRGSVTVELTTVNVMSETMRSTTVKTEVLEAGQGCLLRRNTWIVYRMNEPDTQVVVLSNKELATSESMFDYVAFKEGSLVAAT